MLSSAVAAATGGAAAGKAQEAQISQLSNSELLYPKDVSSASDKLSFLESQQENLRAMLSVVDQAAQKERGGSSGSGSASEKEIEDDVERRMGELDRKGLKKNRSEQSFDAIDPDEAKNGTGKERARTEGAKPAGRRTASGGWAGWFSGGSSEEPEAVAGEQTSSDKATTTGFEKGA